MKIPQLKDVTFCRRSVPIAIASVCSPSSSHTN